LQGCHTDRCTNATGTPAGPWERSQGRRGAVQGTGRRLALGDTRPCGAHLACPGTGAPCSPLYQNGFPPASSAERLLRGADLCSLPFLSGLSTQGGGNPEGNHRRFRCRGSDGGQGIGHTRPGSVGPGSGTTLPAVHQAAGMVRSAPPCRPAGQRAADQAPPPPPAGLRSAKEMVLVRGTTTGGSPGSSARNRDLLDALGIVRVVPLEQGQVQGEQLAGDDGHDGGQPLRHILHQGQRGHRLFQQLLPI